MGKFLCPDCGYEHEEGECETEVVSNIVFVDKFGHEWDEDSLNELIETLETLNKALDRVSYYKNEL